MTRRNVSALHKAQQQLTGVRRNHAAAEQDDRTLCRVDHLCHLGNLLVLNLRIRALMYRRLVLKLTDCRGDVLRNINENRTRTAADGDFICLTNGVCQLLNVADNEVVLGNRHGHACNVNFLKAVSADKIGADIRGNGNERNGIHKCGCDAGDEVGRTRTRRCQNNAYLAGGAGIAVCRMRCALLVRRQNMADAVGILVQFIINVQGCAARITKNGVGTLFQQCLKQNL